jgi:DNA processing protein
MSTSLLYEIALGLIPGIGQQTTKQLISYCGSAEEVFKTSRQRLLKIPGIGPALAQAVTTHTVLQRAEALILQAQQNNVRVLFYTQKDYPERLRQIADAPTLLFVKGNAELQTGKIIGIVGTRQATAYGKETTHAIIEALQPYKPLIVSGLAYGIDIHAHKCALHYQLPTLGVMASGIDIVYPALHRDIAHKMLEQGGLLTEYLPGTKPDPAYFPARNRIVAGLCDALIVVEAAKKGGALITAEISNSYHKEVFAVPGNLHNKYNEGCHQLIKSHKAHLYTSVRDLEYILNWDLGKKNPDKTFILAEENLSEEEKKIVQLLLLHGELQIDNLSWQSNIPMHQLSSLLLHMEFEGLLRIMPGKKLKLLR